MKPVIIIGIVVVIICVIISIVAAVSLSSSSSASTPSTGSTSSPTYIPFNAGAQTGTGANDWGGGNSIYLFR